MFSKFELLKLVRGGYCMLICPLNQVIYKLSVAENIANVSKAFNSYRPWVHNKNLFTDAKSPWIHLSFPYSVLKEDVRAHLNPQPSLSDDEPTLKLIPLLAWTQVAKRIEPRKQVENKLDKTKSNPIYLDPQRNVFWLVFKYNQKNLQNAWHLWGSFWCESSEIMRFLIKSLPLTLAKIRYRSFHAICVFSKKNTRTFCVFNVFTRETTKTG